MKIESEEIQKRIDKIMIDSLLKAEGTISENEAEKQVRIFKPIKNKGVQIGVRMFFNDNKKTYSIGVHSNQHGFIVSLGFVIDGKTYYQHLFERYPNELKELIQYSKEKFKGDEYYQSRLNRI